MALTKTTNLREASGKKKQRTTGASSKKALSRVSKAKSTGAVARAIATLQSCSTLSTTLKSDDDFMHDEVEGAHISVPPFVEKLKDMIDDPKVSSAAWTKDGKSITVQNPALLAKQLVRYFSVTKLNSFVRQLHFYGFKKVGGTRAKDWIYNHKQFDRKGKNLHKVRRKTSGPDRQIQLLQLKVENLHSALAETQKKLTNVADALVTVLKQHPIACSIMQDSGQAGKRSGGPRPRRISGATKRPAPTPATPRLPMHPVKMESLTLAPRKRPRHFKYDNIVTPPPMGLLPISPIARYEQLSPDRLDDQFRTFEGGENHDFSQMHDFSETPTFSPATVGHKQTPNHLAKLTGA